VLIHRPGVLLLDEPTAGLDPAARQAIWRRLVTQSAQGSAMVLATHDLGEAQRCSHIVLLSQGQVRASGPPAAVARQVPASALIVNGRDAMKFADYLESPELLAAYPSGESVRLIVAADARSRVEALIASHGCQSKQVSLTLEDAALVIAQGARERQ
jgi:ABC-2 type transport system ATP-binding protein